MEDMSVEKLLDRGYDYNLVNQIVKAWQKGYDIRNIDKNIDLEKLRKAIKELEYNEDEIIDENQSLNIYLKIYDAKIRPEILNDKINNALITKGREEGLDLKIYEYINQKATNIKRLTQVGKQGIKNHINIYEYLKEGYHTGQIEVILRCKEKGYNIEKFIDTSYDPDRILAIKRLFDYYYKNSLIPDKQFKNIVNNKFTNKVMKKIIEAISNHRDINIIFNNHYTLTQKNMLLTAINFDLDITKMKNPRLQTSQMNIIMNGIKNGYDVDLYKDERYNEFQMNEIYQILKYNKEHEIKIDPTPILNPEISAEIMNSYLNICKNDKLDEKIEILRKINEKENKFIEKEEIR